MGGLIHFLVKISIFEYNRNEITFPQKGLRSPRLITPRLTRDSSLGVLRSLTCSRRLVRFGPLISLLPMTKKEILWRQILQDSLEKKVKKFTQKELAMGFGYSLSTVFNALKAPRKLGAIEVTGRYFRLIDREKLLFLFATIRNLNKDIIYETSVDAPPREIEGNMPPGIIFGAFSAYRLKYHDAPADYSSIYVYGNEGEDLAALQKRFPKKEGDPNLFVLKKDPCLTAFGGGVTPDAQTFADLWNISAWYAKDYLNALKAKFHLPTP